MPVDLPASAAQIVPSELRTEVLQQASAGCAPEALIAPLLAVGWTEDAAVSAVEALLREHLARHAESHALPAPQRVPAPAALNAEPVLDVGDRRVQVLASLLHPRVVVIGGLLSPRECDALIAAARGRLTPSTVVDPATGSDQRHAARTSEGMSFQRGETELCRRIERRIATLLDWPIENGEGLQILRYAPGAQYRPHHDYFDPAEPGNAVPLARGGQRVATLVMYLNTPRRGGATVFPEAQFEVAPIAGNAVFFSYDRPHAMTRTLHGGAPVHDGEKWIATKWLRVGAHS
jgi:prolyl 4-hydroxylase